MPATQPAGRPGTIRSLARTNQFKKDFKRSVKRGYDESKLQRIVERILKGENSNKGIEITHLLECTTIVESAT